MKEKGMAGTHQRAAAALRRTAAARTPDLTETKAASSSTQCLPLSSPLPPPAAAFRHTARAPPHALEPSAAHEVPHITDGVLEHEPRSA